MCTAERRVKVIRCDLVCEVQHTEAERVMMAVVFVEQVIRADAEVKQVTWRDARRVVIVIRVVGIRKRLTLKLPPGNCVIWLSGVGIWPPHEKPIAACSAPDTARASSRLATSPATRRLS
jgi:hypothetical protein